MSKAVKGPLKKLATNSSLLALLGMGCKIEFTGGYYLKGDPRNSYIDIGTQFGPEGVWNLSDEGVGDAVKDLKRFEHNDLNGVN